MGIFLNVIVNLKNIFSSGADRKAKAIDSERMARVMNPEAVAKREELRQQVFAGRALGEPIGKYVPKTVQDPKGPLAMHLTASERMKIWLSLQKPEVVDAVAQSLNWDEAEEVILWLLKRKKTDAATALKLFMKSEPAYYAIDGVTLRDGDFAKDVIDAFSSNWTTGQYAKGNVGYDPAEPKYTRDQLIEIYGRPEVKNSFGDVETFNGLTVIKEIEHIELDKRSAGKLPWPPLLNLRGPFTGPKPLEAIEYFKNDREGLFTLRFLLAGLGTWFTGDEFDEADYKKWLLVNGFGDEAEQL
jgi:Domain of unknown function (DUF4274)